MPSPQTKGFRQVSSVRRDGVAGCDGIASSDAAAVPAARSQGHDFLAPVILPFQLPTRFYGAMLVVWHLRPVLQRRFPLHRGTVRDFLRFLAWCASEGRREYAILRKIPEWDAELSRPVDLPAVRGDRWVGSYSVGMFLIGVARSHYTFGSLLTSASERHRIARSYWRGDRHARLLPLPDAWQRRALRQRFGSERQLVEALRIPHRDGGKDTELLWREFGLSDLFEDGKDVGMFPAPRSDSMPSFYETNAVLPRRIRRSPVRLPLRGLKSLAWALGRLGPRPHEFQLAGITGRLPGARHPPQRLRGPFGVNLVGYARGELGIGEDVRMLALALEANGVPFCIVDVELGSHVSQLDRSVEQWVSDKPCYPINLFCMTGIEQARYACEQGLDLFEGRYTIGLWPWELPDWPASCRYAFSIVDEIWGISSYTAQAYRRAPCPVYPMSLPVVVEPIGSETRADFDLPEGHFLFLFAFDYHSTLARKNPEGVVRAFRLAFPPRRGDRVGLVIKASHTEHAKGDEWDQLKSLIRADPRIRLLEATLRKPSLLALVRVCDCFVSLHRAEGFGRSIVEALLLGLPIIATGFSGNLDYCHEEQVDLVPYRLREVRRHEYFWGEGQQWAEPDLQHAARRMRYWAGTTAERPRGAAASLSPQRLGSLYGRRLTEIFRSHGVTGFS